MFNKILIANRGEIACRIIKTARRLGIRTVAVYSEADAGSPVVRAADEAVCVGPAAPRQSYLNIPNIIGAALKTGADAVHPGYGFLSEDPDFAEVCAEEGITVVGPPPEVMAALGDKSTARRLMSEAAKDADLAVRVVSFKGSLQALRNWEPHLNQAKLNRIERSRLIADLYEAMTDTPIRQRPGRSEPRCLKRRPKNYELMTRPRHEMKETPHRNRYRAGIA